jgi:sulfate transport system ATP-binding protein
MSIHTESVSKAFGAFHALTDVSVDIPTGRLTALLGPSGGGKSTLLRIIAGLEQPDDGRVFVDGRDVTDIPVRRRGVGFVFQHYAAFTHLTVRENVAFGLKVARRPKREVRERVDELLDLVQLSGLAHRYPSELSGGQRQRMALARALAVRPSLLLLDEPFGALDAKVRQELRAWLRRLHDEVGATTILVTHDQEEAMELADDIVLINGGRIEQAGSPTMLYDHPANDFVRDFLGPVTHLNGMPLRPHDIRVARSPEPASAAATVVRIVHLGFQSRLEAELADGELVTVQLPRSEALDLGLAPGQGIHLVDASRAVATVG